MSGLTTIDLAGVPAAPASGKRIRIPKRIAKAVQLLESGECKTQKAAAERVGMSATYLCESLKKPKIQAFIAQRRAENIALGSLRASYRLPELVNAQSEHVSAQVSQRLLEQSGDLRAANGGIAVNINNNVSPGYVIKLRHADIDATAESTVVHDT